MDRLRVGVVGCGKISGQYFKTAKQFPILDMAAVSDLNMDAANAAAKEWGIPRVCTVEQMLKDPNIDAILNLTIPKAHAEVALKAIENGKHVYSEKPLGINVAEGEAVVNAAKAKGVRVGIAPDTFLGAAHQTARKLIDEGAIGRPVTCTAYFTSRGMEHWHPNPEFYYQPGGGPMFDMGPYYLTDLMQLLGPIKRVSAMTSIAITDRVITSQPLAGRKIEVSTPDHVSGTMEFDNGVIGTIVTTFAVRFAETWPITIFGTEGTLKVADPNRFDGDIFLRREGEEEWTKVEQVHQQGYGRAVGLADMAHAIRDNRAHRASGDLGLAVLDAMAGFLTSGEEDRTVHMKHRAPRPEPLPVNLAEGVLA